MTSTAGQRSLITGIGGFAGAHLAQLLLDAGGEVAGYTLPLPASAAIPLPTGVELVHGDILDREAVGRVIGELRPTTIYHLAAASHVGESWTHRRRTFEINVLGTDTVLEAAASLDPKPRFVVISSGQVYGELFINRDPSNSETDGFEPPTEDAPAQPVSPYAASKLCCEVLGRQAWRGHGLPTLVARPFNFAGPGQEPTFACSEWSRRVALAEAGLTAPLIEVGNLEPRRDFTDVRDMVAGFFAIAQHGRAGAGYNLCSGRAIAISELLDMIVGLSQVPIEIVVDNSRLRPSDVPLFVGDPGRAKRELGWEAARPLSETVTDTLQHWRDRVASDGSETPDA